MRTEKSMKQIAVMQPEERFSLAKAKIEKALTNFLGDFEFRATNEILSNTDTIAKQVPFSREANVYNFFVDAMSRYEVVVLCSYWEDVDLDGHSIPTIVSLARSDSVLERIKDSREKSYTDEFSEFRSPSMIQAIRDYRKVVRQVEAVQESEMLRSVRDFRHRDVHAITQSSLTLSEPISPLRYRDVHRLFFHTLVAVERLNRVLRGSSFSWDSKREMSRRNAKNFWNAVTIDLPRATTD